MVFEHESEHPSQWATIRSVSSKFGMSAGDASFLGSPGRT
jgi:hypothetical protein